MAALVSRANGLCGLCGKSIDLGLRWPDPLSPSRDHIVPLANGGSHMDTNVQVAHLVCNVRKGARATGPLS